MRGGVRNRAFAVTALIAAVVVVAVLLLRGSGETQKLRVQLPNASQLVRGNEVKVGGLPVGTVKSIELTNDNRADVEIELTEEDLLPLHQGTRAWVRVSSLSGVANRYLALEPGPNDAPELEDGGVIRALDTRPAIELDAVLSTLDVDTRSNLQRLAKGGAAIYAGKTEELNRGLRQLNPAISQLESTLAELVRDRGDFERFLVASAAWVSTVADREDDLQAGLAATAETAQAVAAESDSLRRLLGLAPAALRQASGTLQRTASTLRAIEPAVREGGPVAPRLTRLLNDVDPVLRRLPSATEQTRPLLRSLRDYLATTPRLSRAALPAFAAARDALADFQPILAGTLPYVPDALLGATNGFGGTAAGPYDANGSIARIGFMGGAFSLGGVLSLGGATPAPGYKPQQHKRCPGAATQVAPDGSNKLEAPDVPCEESQRP